MRHVRKPRLLLSIVCLSGLLACDRGGEGTGGDEAAKADPAKGAEAIVENAVAQAEKEAGAAKLFDPEDKAFRKRACEFLTPELVAKTYGVNAADLKQQKIMGCLYAYQGDGKVLEARLMMLRVHKKLDGAKLWFNNATATKTKEQLDAEMDMVKKKAQEREEIDTKLKKKTVGDVANMAKMGMPDEGVSYDDVAGLGDEARISNADGVVWIRLGNLTFQVAGFYGPEQPKFEFDPKDTKSIAKKAIAAQKKWVADTLDQRKADVMKLAPAVVKAIEAAR